MCRCSATDDGDDGDVAMTRDVGDLKLLNYRIRP
jgi:hypothetical protein